MARTILLLTAVLLAGLHAGFFFTWSFTVMNGLDAGSPGAAIAAMQSMNANIRNAPFGVVFFGAPIVALFATFVMMASRRGMPAALTLAGFAGLAATVVTTAVVHIPLNEALALQTVPTDMARAADMWMDYAAPWTAWNHLRALTSLVGFLFLGLAFRMDRRN